MSFWSEVDNLIQKGKADKQIKVAIAELVDLRNEINDKEIKIEELEKKLKEQIQISSALTQKVTDLDGQLAELMEKSEQVQKLKGQIEQYQQYIQQLKGQITELGEKQQLSGEETDNFNQQLEKEQQKTTDAIKQSEGLMAQNHELIKQIQTFKDNIQQLENTQANQVSAEQMDEKNQQITHLRMENQSLIEQIKKMQSVAINPAEFEELKKLSEQLHAEAAAGTQKYEMLQREITKLRDEIIVKDKKIKDLSQPRQVMTPTLAPEDITIKSSFNSEIVETSISLPKITPEIKQPSRQTIRNVCPSCGSVNYREVKDKSKIVSYIPTTIYGKKKICMKCTFEF